MDSDITNVEYRAIEGHPGYRVGSDGTVWTCKIVGGNGRLSDTWRLMRVNINKDGYAQVAVATKGKVSRCYVHQFVLEAFGKPRPSMSHITRHLNGIRLDNRPENLEWGTVMQNAVDAISHQTLKRGDQHHRSKLTDEKVGEIAKLLMAGCPQVEIASFFGVRPACISAIKNGRRWRHVTGGCVGRKRHRQCKIPIETVSEIRRLSAMEVANTDIARQFGIHPLTVGMIVRGLTHDIVS